MVGVPDFFRWVSGRRSDHLPDPEVPSHRIVAGPATKAITARSPRPGGAEGDIVEEIEDDVEVGEPGEEDGRTSAGLPFGAR
jgi:hypothetical protein